MSGGIKSKGVKEKVEELKTIGETKVGVNKYLKATKVIGVEGIYYIEEEKETGGVIRGISLGYIEGEKGLAGIIKRYEREDEV